MMILITGAIVVVFGDFASGELTKANDFKANVIELEQNNNNIDAALYKAALYKNLQVSLAKNLPRNYVRKNTKDVHLADIVLQNTGNDVLKLHNLALYVNDLSLATNYRLVNDSDLSVVPIMENGNFVFMGLDLDLQAEETKSLYLIADIDTDALAGSRIRVAMNPSDDVDVFKGSLKLNLSRDTLFAPFVTVVGR